MDVSGDAKLREHRPEIPTVTPLYNWVFLVGYQAGRGVG